MTTEAPEETAIAEPDEPTPGLRAGALALLALALLVLTGGAVYIVGSLMSAEAETEAAQVSAEDDIALYDPDEFVSEFADQDLQADASSPDSLPLADSQDEADVSDEPSETPATPSTTETPQTTVAPHPVVNPADVALVFVNRVPGDDYAKLGYIDREGERHILPTRCVRVDWNVNGGLCLDDSSVLSAAEGYLLDPGLVPQTRFPLSKPSRTAVSPDGSVVAWTGFTVGHSYLLAGEFATVTQLIDVNRSIGANLEDIWTTYNLVGDPVVANDRNYWGVSFVDSDQFYATLGSGGETSIVEGRVSTSRLDIRFENASCPEVSPDGSTIVAKEQRGDVFQLVAIDVATGERRDLTETRSVDDQVEWLDNDTIAYGMPNPDEGTSSQPAFDIWVLDVAEGSTPRVLLPFADSPAA